MKREELLIALLENSSWAFILESDAHFLKNCYDVPTNGTIDGLSLFLKYGALQSSEKLYLVIHNIDLCDIHMQTDLFCMAKNRCFRTFGDIPDDMIIVFTVSDRKNATQIEYNLWNFGANLMDI